MHNSSISRPGFRLVTQFFRLLPIALVLSSCAALRPARVPIETVEIASGDGRCLTILLPGRFSGPERFETEGFAKALTDRDISMDLVAVNAHLGYYRKRSVIDRIRLDVVKPAQEAGYEEIWIAGTSLGGTGTLLYLREHPEDLSGALAIAPFLGDEEVIDEVESAGGATKWAPPDSIEADDVGRQLWSWLPPGSGRSENVPLHLAWGTRDDFDRSNRLLAEILPEDRVYTHDGAHDWPTWLALWKDFLDRSKPCS